MKQLKALKPEDCDRILEALAVGSVIGTLYSSSAALGIFFAPVAIYCLIAKYKGKADS